MKVSVLVFVVLIGFVAAKEDEEFSQKWQEYQKRFGKTYRSGVEARIRMTVFKENLERIEKHNVLYKLGKTTHKEGINQFTDWTKEEFMEYVNKGLITKPVITGITFNKTGNIGSGTVDWRTAGVVTPVKNQGQCGSCWSFSATGAIEGQLGRKNNLMSLSEQMLIDCSAVYGNNGCNGGYMTAAFKFVKDNGIMLEEQYPYTGTMGYCTATPSKVVTRISSFVTVPVGDETSLKEAIASVGPIAVAIDATENLQSYSGGILQDESCSSRTLNHGVLAVGYGNENGVDFYIVKNSWGSTWGEEGYFRLGRNTYNPCGIASMASYPVL